MSTVVERFCGVSSWMMEVSKFNETVDISSLRYVDGKVRIYLLVLEMNTKEVGDLIMKVNLVMINQFLLGGLFNLTRGTEINKVIYK